MRIVWNVRPLAAGMIVGVAACSREPAPPAPTDSQPTYDMAVIMNGLAQSLREEQAILSKAIRTWQLIEEYDRKSLGEALHEQQRWGHQIEAMLRANPSWNKSTCEWFASVVKPVHEEVVRLRLQLAGVSFASGSARNRHSQLLIGAAGSQDAAREVLQWRTEAPGSPENIFIMCIKFGHIDDDGRK